MRLWRVDEEDMMLSLLEVLDEETLIPDVGRYYTFIYKSFKTPNILYDQHPLIACVGLFGVGIPWSQLSLGDFHNYTWEEVQGQLHVIYQK